MNARLVGLLVSIVFSVPFAELASAYPAEVSGVSYLKVREAPDFEAEEMGVLSAGEVVDVIGKVGRWANVALKNGTNGYVSGKYLSPVKAIAPRPATAMAPPEEQFKEDNQKTDAAKTVGRLGVMHAPEGVVPPQDLPDQPKEDDQKIDGANTTGRPEAMSAPERAGPSQDSPLPPGKPQVDVTGTDQPRTRRPTLCTRADLQELRRELKKLAAAQNRLAELMAAGVGEEPAGRDWSASISTRQMLFWLAAGWVLGWLAAVGFRHRRERRQRSRIRI
jgi:Bacterial SH3 domain